MSFDTDTRSVHGSRPVELWLIVTAGATYRYTTANVDIVFAGDTYTSIPGSRSNLVSASVSNPPELELTLPAGVAAVTDNAFLVPYRDTHLTVTQVQTGGDGEVVWDGAITSITIEGDTARIRSPSPLADALNTTVPSARIQRICNHPLYGTMCGVDRASFKVTTTVSIVNGVKITPASLGGHGVTWFQFGEIVRAADGERRTIISDLAGILTIDMPFRTLAVGNAVDLYAGCDRSIDGLNGCAPKFANAINFGGHPYTPTVNPFARVLTNREWTHA